MKEKNHFVVSCNNSDGGYTLLNVFDDKNSSILYAKKIFKLIEKKYKYSPSICVVEVGHQGIREVFAIFRPYSSSKRLKNIKIFDEISEWVSIDKTIKYL